MSSTSIAACDDRELLGRFARSADESAFEALVERHGPMVRGVCGRMVGDPNRADDAAQATFVLLARHARRLHVRPGSLAPWLHRVATNASAQLLRSERARARREREAASRRGESMNPQDDSAWVAALPLLDEEIERLPEADRTLIVLHHLQDRPQHEVAAAAGLSYGTFRRRLDRARRRLRSRLAGRGVVLGVAGLAALPLRDASASTWRPTFRGLDAAAAKRVDAVEGVSPEAARLIRRLDFQLRHGAAIKAAVVCSATGAVAALLALRRLAAAVAVVVVVVEPLPTAVVEPPPAPPVVAAPTKAKAKESFYAEVVIDGERRTFDDKAEYDSFLRTTARPARAGAGARVGVDPPIEDDAGEEFTGEVVIDGRAVRFRDRDAYEQARRRLIDP